MMNETLKNLCSTNGWCYAVFWGFDHTNSLLLTLKDCYYEEQMGALIESMLLQAHVVGGGVIGQTAFANKPIWLDSDALHERRNCAVSFDGLDIFQDSEFFYQFSMGIKTIAVIPVEPWGVVELGSTHKKPEMHDFVDQVQQVFREIDVIEGVGNGSHSDSHLFNSSMQLDSSLSSGIFRSENLIGADQSLVLPCQPFPCTSNQLEHLLLESPNFLDCSAYADDFSLLTSSWPHLDNTSLSEPRDEESCKDSSSNAPLVLPQHSSRDISNAQDLSSSMITPTDSKAERLSGLQTVEEFFAQLISPHTARVGTDSSGLMKGSSLSGRSRTSFPTTSLQSSVTYALGPSGDAKCSMGVERVRNESECISENNVGSKMSSSNSLFSKLGLDQLLDTSPSSLDRSPFEDQSSSAAKRRRTGNFSWSQSQVKFDGKLKSYNPEAKNNRVSSEDSKKTMRSCIDDSCRLDASTSRRHEEQVRTKKKKAKPGTKPRPKDRQMIQDRLGELRGLIPNGEKMSIDRLLERTIRHLNFMQSLTRHAESLKQIAKPKSMEVWKNQSMNGGDGGVTWAYEVGNDAMVCPLIVEDLSTPGQMLIEILCEEHGFFLEIIEIVRGFGLTILKGEMEVREMKKIWAHFMVEAEGTRYVTRHEIFSSLIQLLQMTGQSAANGNVGISVFNSFQPSATFPLNFGDALQCASL
ncbi:transcription factor EMB1444-like isoform X2 [Salvia miltiorrhiza]|uniref:transcription factor EMB1444-like isoform X2 n=1 Tax=Salvia miltiorrhiza TaxID=226208 RepID=UPI0025AC5E0F|nr:transcription factor EMB1444-like isoform X2 [Salvia miltiorrhiza]